MLCDVTLNALWGHVRCSVRSLSVLCEVTFDALWGHTMLCEVAFSALWCHIWCSVMTHLMFCEVTIDAFWGLVRNSERSHSGALWGHFQCFVRSYLMLSEVTFDALWGHALCFVRSHSMLSEVTFSLLWGHLVLSKVFAMPVVLDFLLCWPISVCVAVVLQCWLNEFIFSVFWLCGFISNALWGHCTRCLLLYTALNGVWS